jgi:hypothetical protein
VHGLSAWKGARQQSTSKKLNQAWGAQRNPLRTELDGNNA